MNVLEILKDPKTRSEFEKLSPQDQVAFAWRAQWLAKAHKHQILPPGDWWSIWLMLAGRGAGKTRTAAEQIGWWAWSHPNTRWLVAAPTSSDVRATCYEGDSGLLSVIPPQLVADYNKALHELKLINGSLIKGIPASEPERFRGPQFHGGWCCLPGTSILMADGSEKAVEAIQCGESVMTRHGPRKVLAAGISGNPSGLVTITTGQTSLTVTEDHPILVDSQWIPAGDIKEGDLVWTASFTTASHGTKGLAAITTTSAADICIDISGKKQTGRSRQSSSFTTPITTSRTTSLRTLFSCLRRITSGITRPAGQCQSSGSGRPKRSLLLQESLSRRCASFVQRALSLTRWARPLSSVPRLAWSGGGVTHSSLSSEPVLFAKAATSPSSRFSGIAQGGATLDQQPVPIELTQQAVESVARSPNSTTYNLTVEGEHEFIANGIVVHNCDELAAWDYLQEAWDQMQFGLRLKLPNMPTRLICTTTPKPKDLIIELVGRNGDDVAVTTASTYSNLDNLSDSFRKQILQYEGTKLGRQEIYAEIIDPEDGGIVRRDWFRLWPAGKEFPKFEYIVQSYDCATSEKTINDPTAAETWGVFKPLDGPMSVMLIDCWQDRLQYPELREKVQEEYEVIFGEGKDKKRVDTILVEDKSAGISLIQDLRRAHLPVAAYNPGKADKIQRLNIVSHIIARGRVWIPESDKRKGYVKDWAEPLVSQICSFPDSTHDDFVDACTQALRWLRDAGWLEVDPPPRDDWDEDDYVDTGRTRENPYAV
jgi:predicted phage terminase large subunit-like protein